MGKAVLGIDVGGSATKIVGFREHNGKRELFAVHALDELGYGEGGRHEQRIRALVGNLHIVLDGTVYLDPLHGDKTANAVILMDHQITGGQVRKGAELLPVGSAFFRLSFHFALGD